MDGSISGCKNDKEEASLECRLAYKLSYETQDKMKLIKNKGMQVIFQSTSIM